MNAQTKSKFSFFTLCFGAFLDWLSYGLVYPIFATLIFSDDSIFLSEASDAARGFWLGALIATSPLGQFFAAPFLGALSDKIGRKLILQISYLIILTGYFLSAAGVWKQDFFFLILGRFVTGIGAGNLSVINSSAADLSPPNKKTSNFALIAMSSGIGFSVGPLIGGKLSEWGFDIPFIFSGILSIVAFLFFSFFFIESNTEREVVRTDFRLRLYPKLSSLKNEKTRFLIPAFFMFCFGWSFYWEFIPVAWIKIYGRNAPQIGNFYAYGSAIFVLSSAFLVQPIAKKFKASSILTCAWFTLGICFLLLIHARVSFFWIYIPIQQFLVAMIFPVGTTIISDSVPKNQQGVTLGTFQSLQSFAFAITPFLGGSLLDLRYDIPLIVSSAAMLSACSIYFVGNRKYI